MAKKVKSETDDRLSIENFDSIKNMDKVERIKILKDKMSKSNLGLEVNQIKDKPKVDKKDVISTGVLSVDRALKIFGFPRGRIIELYGREGSGKTLLSLLAAGNVQRAGGIAMLFDMECAYTAEFGSLLGVSDELVHITPESAEQAFDAILEVIETGTVDLIIVDSVANMVPKAEIEGEMGDNQVALLARIMSKGLRKITNAISRTKTCLIFINQIRMKVGVMFGDNRTTTGGMALPFYASMRVEITAPSKGIIKNGEKVIGHHSHIKVQKNKVGAPYGEGDMYIYYELGIDSVQDICTVAREEGIIEGTTWLSYKSDIYPENDGIIKMQGFDKFVDFMRNYKSIVYEMRDKVIAKIERETEEFQKRRNLLLEEKEEEALALREANSLQEDI